jgi:hypothetical protein
MGGSWYNLTPGNSLQRSLCEDEQPKERKAAAVMDKINDKYGEFMVVPGSMIGMDAVILDRIAFGGVKESEDLYQAA